MRSSRCRLRFKHPTIFFYALGLFLLGVANATAQTPTDEQRRQEHCMNNPCPGDDQPKYDWATEQPFKRGGKWFVGPREYFSIDGGGAFYWPSKTAAHSGRRDFPERAQVRAGKFSSVAIEFFIEAQEQQGELYEFIETSARAGTIVSREKLRDGLDVVKIKSSFSKIEPLETYYIATALQTPAGAPPTVHCRHVHERAACTTGFSWRPGYRIVVRFRQHHGKDWPEIYSEIIRVLGLVEER